MIKKVTLLPDRRVLETTTTENLLELLRENGAAPAAPCGGQGTCGKCRVLLDGAEVLACQTTVDADCTVEVRKEQRASILTDGIGSSVALDPVRSGNLLAIDIGTTTVVAFLLDGETGEELASASMLNPQAPYGADVISRLQNALSGSLKAQQTLIAEGLVSLTETVCRASGTDPGAIGVVAVVGNPAMQQLFLGISPENLVAVPFAPVLTEPSERPAKEYLPICENAVLLIVPDIAGYVGADTVGCILSTELYRRAGNLLMVDIGTNGEMVLSANGRMAACSTAAGPALEGAKIRFGMRGSEGAIDHVWMEEGRLCYHVIGDGEANGICGSGLIDAVAVFLENGQINKRGRIRSEEERDGERFLPVSDEVWLTQTDIREVMLAKGAIAAGIELLAGHLGISVSDIDAVLLAGAFGSFMDPHNACRIGLLPAELDGKIETVGNAAGSGARRIACSREEFVRTGQLIREIEFVELADVPQFMHTFATRMNFEE